VADDYRALNRLLAAGVPYEALAAALVREGVAPDTAERLATRAAAREAVERARGRAATLLGQGLEPAEAERRLVSEGYQPDAAAEAVLAERSAGARAREAGSEEDWRWGLWTGIVVFALGVVLAIGNNTGIFASFPYAGRIFMGVGTLVIVVARR
jgi:hypothetical protein